ncbi:MAG: PadR family transcriptional regulator [Patescibacteria group bacterium]|nr:PadR family transcriptional regulator [Patescibacteria group bacterium]
MKKKIILKSKCGYPERRWVQFLLLRVIYEKPSYGYEIIKKTEKITDNYHKIKTGTAYTLLRRMEKEGLLKSDWKKNKQGPNKRIYTVTPKGKGHLKAWLKMIIQRKKMINKMVSFYKKHFRDKN